MVFHYRKGFGCVFGENAQSCFLVDFQGEEVERVSCDQMRLCLNNKNGTHGEFRCNWQRSAVGWWVEDPPRTASRSATSQRRREGPYGPAFASHPPTLCAAANVGGEEQEIKWERETGTWIPLYLTVYFQPDPSPNLQPTYMHYALWTIYMHFTGRSLKPSLRLEHESPFIIACQQEQCRNPTKCLFIVTKKSTNENHSRAWTQ